MHMIHAVDSYLYLSCVLKSLRLAHQSKKSICRFQPRNSETGIALSAVFGPLVNIYIEERHHQGKMLAVALVFYRN